ncbi:hypothetical protein D1165_14095, partial [Muribaculaceae bacterium M3]|nr:hypothetical protein [Muribaculaceae bacterium M3]
PITLRRYGTFSYLSESDGYEKLVGKASLYKGGIPNNQFDTGLVRRVGKEAALGIKNNFQMKIDNAIVPLLRIFYCNSISLKKRGDGRK